MKQHGETFTVDGEVIPVGVIDRAFAYLAWVWNKSHYHGTEMATLLFIAVCGLILANPQTETFASSPGFAPLAARATEGVWAFVTLSLPILSIRAAYTGNYWMRLTVMLAAVFWFIFVGGMFTLANPIGFGLAWCSLSFGPTWAFWRLLSEWEERAGDTPFGRFLRLSLDITAHAEEGFRRRRRPRR